MSEIQKIENHTPDLTAENIDKIIQLFPEVATEVRDPQTDEVKLAVDFDALRDKLGDVAEGTRERYQFTWPGKHKAKIEARIPIAKTLRPVKERSKNWDTTGNLYIEGDNLDALKILRESYAGKIKIIYIDPPYNTGHDFIYNDDFSKSAKENRVESGDFNESGNKLVANPESNGRFHSDWCSMMYPRLILARDLLTKDGLIFISIDDNESTNVRAICNEIFGNNCFLNSITWVSNLKGRQISNAGAAKTTESILVYCKNPEHAPILQADTELMKQLMPTTYRGINYEIFKDEIGSFVIKNELFNTNSKFNEETRPSLVFDILWDPNTGKIDTCDVNKSIPKNYIRISPHKNSDGTHQYHAWRWSRNKIAAESHNLYFKKTGPSNATVYTKVRNYSKTTLKDIITDISTSTGTSEVNHIFGERVFDYAKPSILIQIILGAINDKEMTVLDFFSGSGTTAQAVMQLNHKDGGHRKFIMVQLPEKIGITSNIANKSYKTICEIGEDRINKSGELILKSDFNDQNHASREKKHTDIGFRVFCIDNSNFKNTRHTADNYSQDQLGLDIEITKEDRTPFDLLFETLPSFQLGYNVPIEIVTVQSDRDYTIFKVNKGQLLACFDKNIPENIIRNMASQDPRPSYVVVAERSLPSSAARTNFAEFFKQTDSETNGQTQIRII